MKTAFFIVFLFMVSPAFCQQDPLFTQYMFNKLAFNPAYAGSGNMFCFDMIARLQWVQMEGAPRTYSVTAHTPLRDRRIGLGIFAYRDELGPTADNGVLASFAYRILLPSSTLAFGVQAGFKYMDIDWAKLQPKDPGDPLLINQVTNRAVPDADIGIYYSRQRFYAGISSRHLFQNQIIVSGSAPDEQTGFTRLKRNMYLMTGGAIAVGENLEILPSLLVKYVDGLPLQADLSAGFLILKRCNAGISYRTGQAIGLMAGCDIGAGFSVGYSYDIWFNVLKSYNSGSHEIRVSYEVGLWNKERMLTPRFF
jgi:type IX secretion system PorP/SprF family membrane protein